MPPSSIRPLGHEIPSFRQLGLKVRELIVLAEDGRLWVQLGVDRVELCAFTRDVGAKVDVASAGVWDEDLAEKCLIAVDSGCNADEDELVD